MEAVEDTMVSSSSHPVDDGSLSSEKLASQLEAGESKNIVNVECADHENNFKVNDPELKITPENDFKEGESINTVDSEQAFERTLSELEAQAEAVATKEEMIAALECLRKSLRDQEKEAKIAKEQMDAEIEIYKAKNEELQTKMAETVNKVTDMEAKFETSEMTAHKLGKEKSEMETDFEQFKSTFLMEKEQLLAKIEELQSTNVASEQLDSLEKALAENVGKIEELTGDLETTKLAVLKSVEEKDLLSAQYADITNSFENKIDQLNTTILKLEESLAGAEKCFTAQLQEMQTELDAVRSEKDEGHRRRLAEMETNLLELQGQCQSLEKDAIKSTLEKEDVSQELADFQKSAQNQVDELNQKLQELLEAAAVQNQTHDLDSQTQTLENNLQEIKMEKEQLEKTLEEVKLELEKHEVLLSEMRQEKQDLKNSLNQLNGDWQGREAELEEIKKQSEQDKSARELLEGKIEKLTLEQSTQEADRKQKEAEAGRNMSELEVANINLTETTQLLTKNLENVQSEKKELVSALSDANSRVQELESRSATFQQDKETEITSLVESLKTEAEDQSSQLKAQIAELQKSVQAAEFNRFKQNDEFNEGISKQRADAAVLQAELSNKDTQMKELQHEHGQLETNFEEVRGKKLELEKSIYHLNKALKERERELQSRIYEVENSLEATQPDLATQKEGFQRSLESHISENGGLRRALSEAEKSISDARKEKEEMAEAFVEFRKTTEFHKEQLQGRISELETSYKITEAKLAKQNEALKTEVEEYRAKEDHLIQALAQAEVKLRQLQLPRANSSVDKRSRSHHKSSSDSPSLKKMEHNVSNPSAKKTESTLTRSRLDTPKKLEAKKLEAKKSESLKKERGELVKKLELALTKRTETPKRLDSAKKLVEPPRTAPRDPSSSSAKKGTNSSSSSMKKRAQVPSTIFSDTSLSDMEPTSSPPPSSEILTNLLKKCTATGVKKSGESSPGKKSAEVEKNKEILRGLRDRLF